MAFERQPHTPSPEEVAQLSAEEAAAAAAVYLERLEPGRQPLELYTQLSRLTVMSTVELVPLRKDPETGRIQALLTQRPEDDKWWPNQWHVPGSTILPSDEVTDDDLIDFKNEDFNPLDSYRSPLDRIVAEELRGGIDIVEGPYLLEARHRAGIRGPESTVMFWAEVETVDGLVLPVGQFFDAEDIGAQSPVGGLIVGHAGLIERAAAAYGHRHTN